MNLKNLKLVLPKTWREVSRLGAENQIAIRVCHISPLAGIDRKIFQDQIISETSNGSVETVIRKGVNLPTTGRPLNEFYEAMKAFIAVGYLPGWNLQKLDKLWKEMTETPGAEHPGAADFSAEVTVAKYQDEKIAKQMLKNFGLMPTKGFNVPMPGGKVPGMPEDMTITQYLESDFLENQLKKHVSQEEIDKMRSEIKKVQKQMPEVRKDLAKSGVKYQEKKYLGCEAIIAGTSGSKCCQVLRVKNFLIMGMLLNVALIMAKNLPPGSTPCDSLTKLAPKPEIIREMIGGKLFVTKEYHPAKSTYAQEGYLHKEEAGGILKSIITTLKK